MIALLLDETIEKYEQDLRELLMAFFPGEVFCYEKKPEAGLFVCGEKDGLGVSGGAAFPEGAAAGGTLQAPLCLTESRSENKTRIKKALYGLLHGLTGEELPWGTLTGIRPVKLPEKMMKEGMADPEILKRAWAEM